MIMKNRILLLRDYLQEHSDEKHPVQTAEIRKYLRESGCPVSIPTLRTDIQSLLDIGYEIEILEEEGKPTTYAWLSREWDEPEIQILADAVSSSQFITADKSEALIEKLSGLAGPSVKEALMPPIIVSEHVKAANEEIYYIVQKIRKAIRQKRQIEFPYYHCSIQEDKEEYKLSQTKTAQTVSPYATVWNSDKYYMIGWSDEKKKIVPYRVDRMGMPSILSRIAKNCPADFDIQEYTDRIFWMYGGPKETVTLRCRHSILDQVNDKFGETKSISNIQKDTFDITVPVFLSGTFYAWVFQFVGEMNIIAPGHVKDAYADYLQQAIDDVLGT